MKKYRQGKLSLASTEKKMDGTNWSSDFHLHNKFSKTEILAFCY